MAIQTGDIKLLKSQVLLDTSDGGGAMTAGEVVDGVSNNLFPDVSTANRTFGAFQLRKVYAAILTSTTDSYYGSSLVIGKNPEDPKVNVTMFTTGSWTDRRAEAKDRVQRYLATGPRLTCRLMEAHYAGSLLLNLLAGTTTEFPKAGDAIVLRTPAGVEQYVRIITVSIRAQRLSIEGANGQVQAYDAQICACELGAPLLYDFIGPPLSQSSSATPTFSQVFSTVLAAGARFYGTKPIVQSAALGDITVKVPEIFSAIVPSTTAETALIDQYPIGKAKSLSRTGIDFLTLPAVTLVLSPNTVLTLPIAAQPSTVTIVHGSTAFTDNGNGELLQGTIVVGNIDYLGKRITMASTAPSYASNSCAVTYKPASAVGTAAHSAAVTVAAPGGQVFTNALEPVPAAGSLTISYMAQGNWYDLKDNGNGRLVGAESSYGSGTVNYTTGSVGLTLGALPDIASSIIYTWGDSSSAKTLQTDKLPTRLSTVIPLLPNKFSATLTWDSGGVSKTASVSNWQITGDATGKRLFDSIEFSPTSFPDGDISIAATEVVTGTPVVQPFPASATLEANIRPFSVSTSIKLSPQSGFEIPANELNVRDDGAGVLRIYEPYKLINQNPAVGTVNYTTGELFIYSSTFVDTYENIIRSFLPFENTPKTYSVREFRPLRSVSILTAVSTVTYSKVAGSSSQITSTHTPTDWSMSVALFKGETLQTDSAAFNVGTVPFTTASGVIRKGWSVLTGQSDGNNVGSLTAEGKVSITGAFTGTNAISWKNAALTTASELIGSGVFRTANAPLKTGVIQLQSGALIATANAQGVLSGGGFTGTVDFTRGIVTWKREAAATTYNGFGGGFGTPIAYPAFVSNAIAGESLSYNAVYLQFVPIDSSILGLDTARLPLDGRVPIYRKGDMLVVHHTTKTAFAGTPSVGQVLNVGRVRLASLRVVDSDGLALSDAMYTVDLDAGTCTLKSNYAIGALVLPLYAEHRVEDSAVMTDVQISGDIKLNQPLTHAYPATETQASSALFIGDLQARVYGKFSQESWAGTWSDTVSGNATASQFNDALYPIVTTNSGAQEEKWALVFTSNTAFRIIGQSVGQIGTGNTSSDCAPLNPATGQPYFSVPAVGWGQGWSAGNSLRFNTAAANAPVWLARTILQGQSSITNDNFQLQVRGDIDR